MPQALPASLSRRERQILEFLYRLRAATVSDVQAGIPDAPSYSAVRALLRILEAKGHIRHRTEGSRYIYEPVQPRGLARRSALRHLVNTFFDGSAEDAVTALITLSGDQLDASSMDRLAEVIAQARREGR